MIGLKRRLKKNGWREKKTNWELSTTGMFDMTFDMTCESSFFPAFDLLSVHKAANGFENLASKR